MDKSQHRSEQRTIGDRARRREALGNPEHFYPRPQDVIADDSLSVDEKREVLDNWLLVLEDRAGALGQAHGPGEESAHHEEREALRRAVEEARRTLEQH